MNRCKVHAVCVFFPPKKYIHTLKSTHVESVVFMSCVSLYDDILIKVISHNVGTVIRHKSRPSGVIAALVQHPKKRKRKEERNGGVS